MTHFLGADAEVPAVSAGAAVPTVQHRGSAAHPKSADPLSISDPAETTVPSAAKGSVTVSFAGMRNTDQGPTETRHHLRRILQTQLNALTQSFAYPRILSCVTSANLVSPQHRQEADRKGSTPQKMSQQDHVPPCTLITLQGRDMLVPGAREHQQGCWSTGRESKADPGCFDGDIFQGILNRFIRCFIQFL